MSSALHTVIVGHARFPKGLLTAAERIVGKQKGVATISNDNLGVEDLSLFLERRLGSVEGDVYIFVDLVGGSCFNACREVMPSHPRWVLIAGVNLPMLVTYLTYRTKLSGEALLEKTLEAGKRGMEKFYA